MSDLNLTHVFVLISVTVVTVLLVSSYLRARHSWAMRSKGSRRFQEAAAASLVVAKFDHLVMAAAADAKEGVRNLPEIFIPTGDGLYLIRTDGRKADLWRDALQRWLKWGARITMIVTIPSGEARALWEPLTSKAYAGTLKIVFLHRDKAPTSEYGSEIGKLDTFHPCLLVTGMQENGWPTGAMWIENYHAVGSPIAQKIEFIAPKEAAVDGRFGKYLTSIRALLSLGGPCVEALESLSQPKASSGEKSGRGPGPGREAAVAA